jgi:hypothetical protein
MEIGPQLPGERGFDGNQMATPFKSLSSDANLLSGLRGRLLEYVPSPPKSFISVDSHRLSNLMSLQRAMCCA